MATEKMLDLGTGHLPWSHPPFGKHRFVKHEYGFIVFVPGGFDEEQLKDSNEIREALQTGSNETPEWLLPIMVVASQEKCILINFDQDGDVDDRFKTYDW